VSDFETVIGVEVHARLLTRTKLFCRCSTEPSPPNTRTCPTCLGLPGALPALNGAAVAMAVRAGLALECSINTTSRFDRKSYFYPDLPKGFQCTQHALPIAERGSIDLDRVMGRDHASAKSGPVRIRRIHLEEDAAKSVHDATVGRSLVDFNRSGAPLIEIVSEPDLRSAADASDYLRALRSALMFIGVNDGNLEDGSFRCDVNVSVRPVGESSLGARCELKNINSFRFVARAIELESRKQREALSRGEGVQQCTKQYNAERDDTVLLREKGEAEDYRYFAEPDLPSLLVPESMIERERAAVGERPWDKRERFQQALGGSRESAETLIEHPALARYFERVIALGAAPLRAANFIVNELRRGVAYDGLEANFPLDEPRLVALLALVERAVISPKAAKELYRTMVSDRGDRRSPAEIVEAQGRAMIDDDALIEAACAEVIRDNPRQADSFRRGKMGILGFLVGAVMAATDGRAAPEKVNAALLRLLQR